MVDSLLWIARAIIISVGIVMFVKIWKWKKEGKLKERFHIYFFVLGSTCLILGCFLLIISWVTTLSSFYGLYLGAVGMVSFIVALLM